MMAGTFFKWLVPGVVAIAGGTTLALTQAAPALTASLEGRTRAALADDFDWAAIQIDGRDAILTGTAASQAEIDAAAARLAGVEGIRIAQAEAVVAEPTANASSPALPASVPSVAPYLWSATKSADGSISLAGYLPTEALKQTVLERLGPGVDDKTSIATGAPAGFTNDLLAGLEALALLGEGKASFDGGRWTLSGTVASQDAREAALAALDAGTRNEERWLTTITDEAPSVSSVAPPSEPASAQSDSIVSLEPIAPPASEPPSAEPAAPEPSSAPPSAAPSSSEPSYSEPSSAEASSAPSSVEPVSSAGPLPPSSQGQSSSSTTAEPPPPSESSSSVAASSSVAPVEPPALASSQPSAEAAPSSESPSSASAPAEPPTTEPASSASEESVRPPPAAEPSSAPPSSSASAPPSPPATPSLEPRTQETAPSSSAPSAAPSAPTPSVEMPDTLVFSADKPAGGEIVETEAEPADLSPADAEAPSSSAVPSSAAPAVPAAPSAFATSRQAGLAALDQLEEGRIGFDGRRWWLTGKAATQAIRDSVASTVAALPAGADWSVEIDILPAVDACRLRVDGLADRNAILFAPASARLADGSSAALDELAADLAICPDTFVHVEGHTDADGADEANLILSVSRAEAVVAALVERGVDEGRLYAEGYGESRPIASNDTREGKQQNRRIAFRITEE